MKHLPICSVALMGVLALPGAASVAEPAPMAATVVAPGVWMLGAEICNIGVLAGPDGVLIVDDQYRSAVPRILTALSAIQAGPVRFVVNTHWHADHSGGNELLAKQGAVLLAHENVRRRMSVPQFMPAYSQTVPAAPPAALQLLTFTDAITLHFNGEVVHIAHAAGAHTDGDVIVRFERANVIHIGDIYSRRRLPMDTLALPAIPARAPRAQELDLNGVRAAMLMARNALPRSLEIARLGRVGRSAALFLLGHLLLRRGAHSVPVVCVSGAADTDLARILGAHPALQYIKATIERSEKQFRRQAQQFHVIFAHAILNARHRLVVVPPMASDLFDRESVELMATVAVRGVQVEIRMPESDVRSIERDDKLVAALNRIKLVVQPGQGERCGLSCDDRYAVLGITKGCSSSMGSVNVFLGALVAAGGESERTLNSYLSHTSSVSITTRKRRLSPSGMEGTE